MRKITRSALLALAVSSAMGAVGLLAAPGAEAASAPRPPEEHCVLRVTGQDEATGELRTGPMTCASTTRGAVRRAGVPQALADWPIGVHYDGAGLTGSSLTVVGSDCLGGWLNLPSTWNNRISSTQNGCPRIRHYDGANLTGSSESTFSPGGNLGPLNNIATSVQYLT